MDTVQWVFLLVAFGATVWGLRKIGLGSVLSLVGAFVTVLVLGEAGVLDQVVQLALIALAVFIAAKTALWVARMARARREQAEAATVRSPEFNSF